MRSVRAVPASIWVVALARYLDKLSPRGSDPRCAAASARSLATCTTAVGTLIVGKTSLMSVSICICGEGRCCPGARRRSLHPHEPIHQFGVMHGRAGLIPAGEVLHPRRVPPSVRASRGPTVRLRSLVLFDRGVRHEEHQAFASFWERRCEEGACVRALGDAEQRCALLPSVVEDRVDVVHPGFEADAARPV